MKPKTTGVSVVCIMSSLLKNAFVSNMEHWNSARMRPTHLYPQCYWWLQQSKWRFASSPTSFGASARSRLTWGWVTSLSSAEARTNGCVSVSRTRLPQHEWEHELARHVVVAFSGRGNLSEAVAAAALEPGFDCTTGSFPRRNWCLADLVPSQLLPQEEARLVEIRHSKHAKADCLSSKAWKAFGQIWISVQSVRKRWPKFVILLYSFKIDWARTGGTKSFLVSDKHYENGWPVFGPKPKNGKDIRLFEVIDDGTANTCPDTYTVLSISRWELVPSFPVQHAISASNTIVRKQAKEIMNSSLARKIFQKRKRSNGFITLSYSHESRIRQNIFDWANAQWRQALLLMQLWRLGFVAPSSQRVP